MSAIGKGDWVQCLLTRRVPRHPHLGVDEGAVYFVTDVVEVPVSFGRPAGTRGLRFAETATHYTIEGDIPGFYNPDWFRPLGGGGRSSIIEALKQPAPDAVRELIAAD